MAYNLVPATITIPTVTAGVQATFTINRSVSSQLVTVTITVDGESETILFESNVTSFNYTFPFSLFNKPFFWKEKSIPATITITTKWLSRTIGTNTYTVDINAPDAAPINNGITNTLQYASNPPGQTYIDAETLTGKYYNNGLTNIVVSYSFTPQNSRISQVYMTGDFGYHLLYDSSTTPPIGGDGTVTKNTTVRNLYGKTGVNTFTITAVDLRGQMTSQSFTQTLYVASAPVLTNVSYVRGTGNASNFTPDDDGSVIRFTATLSSETTFGIITIYKDGTEVHSSQYASGTVLYYITNVDPTVNTEILVEVHNWLANSSYSYIAPISKPDFNYNPSLHSIGVGKQGDEAKALCLADDWKMMSGDDEVDLVIDQGYDSTTKWRWRKWKSGFGELWLSMGTITPTTSTNDNGQYYSENLYVYPPFMLDSWSMTGTTNNYSYICNPGWSSTNNRYSFRIGRAAPIVTGTAHNLCLYICGTIL